MVPNYGPIRTTRPRSSAGIESPGIFRCTENVIAREMRKSAQSIRASGAPTGMAGLSGSEHSRIVMFMGAPGSGKGTQSALLASRLGVTCISTGAILREESKRNTPAGFRLRQTMAAGALVDDATVCETVVSRILAAGATQSLILDGFPRTVDQARRLDLLLAGLEIPGPLVLHLDVPGDVLLRRLARRRQCAKCGAIYNLAAVGGSRCPIDRGALVERDDDSEGVVAQRLAVYENETLPVVDYYRKREDCNGIYRRIDGNRGQSEIAKEVCDLVMFAASALAA
jgi:adenylate kinase